MFINPTILYYLLSKEGKMKIKPYVQKLESSKEYKDFRAKHPKSYVTAGFFILDFESGKNVHQIDLYIPKEKKVAAFTLDHGVSLQLLDMLHVPKAPEKLDIDTKTDLDALKGILADEMHNRGMSDQIQKIIAVIQNVNGKRIWSLNCVLSGMQILNSHVEDDTQTVLRIDKTTLMDIMKKMPTKGQMPAPGKGDPKAELKNLEKLQTEIEKEKSKLQAELDKAPIKQVKSEVKTLVQDKKKLK